MEWNDEFNSFNSWKGLLYAEHYAGIKAWKESGDNYPLLPPVEVSLDLAEICQLRCSHCNAGRYLNQKDIKGFTATGGYCLPTEHMLALVDYLADWGVKAICFGGGGEPSINRGLANAIERTVERGMEVAVATNGYSMWFEGIGHTDRLINAYAKCRWVGVSVDAGTRSTYLIGKNVDGFDRVIRNLEKLAEINRNTSFKFLIFDYNQHEIYTACKLAKELGVRDFHARPADMRHQGMGDTSNMNNMHRRGISGVIKSGYDVVLINEQLAKCRELEDENFKVFTVTHKFNKDFTPKREFSQCYASPLCLQLSADGNIYLCPDTRHMDFYKLGSHLDVKNIGEVWGSQKHYDLVFKTGCSNCNSRCTFGAYNKQCERLYINNDDPFCKNFV